jgi:hypothetical protein
MKNEGAYLRLVSDRGRAKNVSGGVGDFYEESHFNEMVDLEKKRSQRSGRPLMMIRLDVSELMERNPADVRRKLEQALASGFRDTDVRGWIKRGVVAGIAFTELKSSAPPVRDTLIRRVMASVVSQIDPLSMDKIKVSFHTFPDDEAQGQPGRPFVLGCHRDLVKKATRRNLSSRVKLLKDFGSFLMS